MCRNVHSLHLHCFRKHNLFLAGTEQSEEAVFSVNCGYGEQTALKAAQQLIRFLLTSLSQFSHAHINSVYFFFWHTHLHTQTHTCMHKKDSSTLIMVKDRFVYLHLFGEESKIREQKLIDRLKVSRVQGHIFLNSWVPERSGKGWNIKNMDTKHAGTKNKISKENKYISGTVKRTETRQTDR